jgi:dTMP kinase
MFNKKILIAFEGIDGCGKTTQCKMLCDYLNKQRIVYQYFKFSDDFLNECMFNIIKESFTDVEFFYKYKQAARAYETSKSFYLNCLKNPNYKIIICDRYKYSDNVFLQGQGVDRQIINLLSNWLPDPDLLFYFDIGTDTAMKRIQSRGGKIHWHENEEYISFISNCFRNEIEHVSTILHTLDAKKNIDCLHVEICNAFVESMSKLDVSLFAEI